MESARTAVLFLETPHQQQDNHDEEDNADDAARPVAPRPTVSPRRNDAQQRENENDDEDGTEAHGGSPLKLSSGITVQPPPLFPELDYRRLVLSAKKRMSEDIRQAIEAELAVLCGDRASPLATPSQHLRGGSR
jgi:hypothetical protein